jgi:SAM-dependent methyltransferase
MNTYYKAKRDVSHFSAHVMETFRREGFAQFFVKSCGKLLRLARKNPSAQGIEELEFDRRFGTDTATSIPAWRLSDVSSANRVHATNYVASREKDVSMLFGMLPIQAKDYVFVDFGSGKGKVLLLAGEYGFKKIIGVEFSPSLHAIAEANIERYKSVSSRNCTIESVCQDAAEFAIPSENLVIFLYGPFHEPVFRSVIARLRDSLEAHDRTIFVVNFGSPLAAAIRKIDFLYPLPGKAGQWIYSNKPVTMVQE